MNVLLCYNLKFSQILNFQGGVKKSKTHSPGQDSICKSKLEKLNGC